MRNLALRFLLILVSYLVGQRLLAATLQQGEDMGLGFWDVIRDTFNYTYYPWVRIATMSAIGAAIFLTDLVTPKKIGLVGLALIDAFAGAYYYAMSFSYNYFADIERSADGFFDRSFPAAVATALGDVFFVIAGVLPLLLLVALKLGVPKFREIPGT